MVTLGSRRFRESEHSCSHSIVTWRILLGVHTASCWTKDDDGDSPRNFGARFLSPRTHVVTITSTYYGEGGGRKKNINKNIEKGSRLASTPLRESVYRSPCSWSTLGTTHRSAVTTVFARGGKGLVNVSLPTTHVHSYCTHLYDTRASRPAPDVLRNG